MDRHLATLVVTVPLTETHLARLRARFPDLTVILANEPTAADLAAADGFVGWSIDEPMLAAMPRLVWYQTGGAGVENLPLAALAARGVTLTNNSGVHAINMSEHVLAMMLAFARALPRLIRAQEARRWRDEETRTSTFELHGQQLLLVGLGDIALAVAERAAAFGMHISGVRRRPALDPPASVPTLVPIAQLHDALAAADHVVVSLPLTAATRGLLGAAEIAAMKRGAYLYNVGRGAVIDQAALIDALAVGRLGGAGLDVTDPEPLPVDSPLWGMANVLITAHTSGASPNYWDRGIAIIEENVARFRAGEPLINEVDLDAGY